MPDVITSYRAIADAHNLSDLCLQLRLAEDQAAHYRIMLKRSNGDDAERIAKHLLVSSQKAGELRRRIIDAKAWQSDPEAQAEQRARDKDWIAS